MSDPLAGLPQFIREEMSTARAPGVGIGIVRDGAIIFAEGFGARDISTGASLTPDTLFAIASVTKSFTATALAMHIEQGKLDWDVPLREFLPAWQLRDEIATARATPRDLACHRTGVPRHDVLWYNSPCSRRELVQRLRHLEPSCDFRARFQYSNLMYMTLGYALEEITRASWENIVQQTILNRIGMTRSNITLEATLADPNRASPHILAGENVIAIPWHYTASVGPAGAINSTINEMCQWLLFNLNRGVPLLSEQALAELHTPQIVEAGLMGVRLFTRHREVSHACYGLGWTMFTYRGHNCIFHGGSIDGFTIAASFMPDDGIGIIAYANLHETLLPWLVTFHAYDHLLGLDELPWSQRIRAAKQSDTTRAADRRSNAPSSHALADYAGEYSNPGYGALTIAQNGDALEATFNAIKSNLVHVHYDIFDLVSERYGMTFRASFTTNARGDVDAITIPLEPTASPIVFAR